VFPAQKVSFEAQRERKAGPGQTLTAMGSYWKGRKPLILVRAILLGTLLPQTDEAEADLDIFEQLMGFDDGSLARRALEQSAIKPKDIANLISLQNPWEFFTYKIKNNSVSAEKINLMAFPLDAEEMGITIQWHRDIDESERLNILSLALATYNTYEEKAALCKRPEELDQDWLYAPVWPRVNKHFAHLGINANSHSQLMEQLGILRFGRRPKVADTFSGGGSIPFEAARLGCSVYASDLNPIACMLTWGALNVIGSSQDKAATIIEEQHRVVKAVNQEITALGIEHDNEGNRAKAYLYCLEVRCPEQVGWYLFRLAG